MFAMIFICIIYFSYTGAQMIVVQDLTTGSLMSLITYSVQILSCLMMAFMVMVMCVMAKASGERIAEVLQEESSLKNQ